MSRVPCALLFVVLLLLVFILPGEARLKAAEPATPTPSRTSERSQVPTWDDIADATEAALFGAYAHSSAKGFAEILPDPTKRPRHFLVISENGHTKQVFKLDPENPLRLIVVKGEGDWGNDQASCVAMVAQDKVVLQWSQGGPTWTRLR
jgi:hypothetical protein